MSKNVLITGASRGIGHAIAKLFAQKGYCLFLVCHKNIQKLQDSAQEFSAEYGNENHCFQVDLGNSGEAISFLQTLPEIDIVINNVGLSHIGLLTDMSLEEWNRLLDVNLTSSFLTCKYLLPSMIQKQQGCIINISSIWGNTGASMEVAYSSTKGALNSFTKALAKEVAPSNVQVNAIACGLIATDMNSCFDQEELSALTEEIPAGRMGEPTEVATLCLQLVDAPNYLTGQIINLDGGWE